jgi:phosphohistidine phosphatase
MKLYLVRHAEAIDRSAAMPDAGRYLTPKGRATFRRIARKVRKAGAAPDFIFTSPLVRAVQTAEILSEVLGHEGPLLVARELSPGFDRRKLEILLREAGRPAEAAFVGHEPDLGELVASLLSTAEPFPLRKGAVVALEAALPGRKGGARLLWKTDAKGTTRSL